MYHRGLHQILGRKIKAVAVINHKWMELHLIFDDGTSYEINGNLNFTGNIDSMSKSGVVSLLKHRPKPHRIDVYELVDGEITEEVIESK